MRGATAGRMTQAAVLAVGLAALGGATVWAAPEAFGMFGLGRSETAYLHAVLTAPPDSGQAGCEITLSFVDAHGKVLHDHAGNQVKETFLLKDNVAASLSFSANDVLAESERRQLFRGVVICPTEGLWDCSSLTVTQELMSAQGTFGFDRMLACPGDPIPPTPR